jgi:hypothetical protein
MSIEPIRISSALSFQLAKLLATHPSFYLDENSTMYITSRNTLPVTLMNIGVYKKNSNSNPANFLNDLLTSFNTRDPDLETKYSAAMLNIYLLVVLQHYLGVMNIPLLIRHVQRHRNLFRMDDDMLCIKLVRDNGDIHDLHFFRVIDPPEGPPSSIKLFNGVHISTKYSDGYNRSTLNTFKLISVNFNGRHFNPVEFKKAIDETKRLSEYEIGPNRNSIHSLDNLSLNPDYVTIDTFVKILNTSFNNGLFKYTGDDYYKKINLFLEYYTFHWIVNIPVRTGSRLEYPDALVDILDKCFKQYQEKIMSQEDTTFYTAHKNFFKYTDGSTAYLYRYANVSTSCDSEFRDTFDLCDIEPNKILMFPSYLSCSLNTQKVLGDFLNSTTVLLKIKVTDKLINNCIPLCTNSKYPVESEVLINRNSHFKVNSVYRTNITDTDYSTKTLDTVSTWSKECAGITCLDLEYDYFESDMHYTRNRYGLINNMPPPNRDTGEIILAKFTYRREGGGPISTPNKSKLKNLKDFVHPMVFNNSINNANIAMLSKKTGLNEIELIGNLFSDYFTHNKEILKNEITSAKEKLMEHKSKERANIKAIKNIYHMYAGSLNK